MIKPYVITQAMVKTYMGITDATYDTQIALYIPDVTDDLTRENGICNQSFLFKGTADTDATDMLANVSLTSDEWDELYIGSLIRINGEDGEISDFDEDAETITLTAVLSKTDTEQTLYIRNFPQGAKSVVAQMVFYKVQNSTVSTNYGREIASKSIGPVSVSFGGKSSGDIPAGHVDKFGYPISLTSSLKTIRRKRFI